MKAIILASGTGSRLMPLTKNKPKNLVEVNGKPILKYQLRALLNNNIKDIIITTGPFEKKVKEYISENFNTLKVEYVNNPIYDKTNYIYSLWLTKKLINDDILLLHGDLIFEDSVLEGLLESPEDNAVVVDSQLALPEKDFKGVIKNNYVSKIGINYFDKAIALQPLYKLSKDSFKKWMNSIESFINKGHDSCYAEDALNEISEQIKLRLYDIKGRLCMEIDTNEDLENAKKLITF